MPCSLSSCTSTGFLLYTYALRLTGMQSTGRDGSKIIEINSQHPAYAVFFAEGGKQVSSGDEEGTLSRWRVDDGHEVGEPIRAEGAKIYAAALSPDGKWLVCGLRLVNLSGGKGNVRVWNAQTNELVLDLPGHTKAVWSVDISRDSTKFATGATDGVAFIWSMTTGQPLVGPLQHDGWVAAVQFSPNGDRIATATAENPDAKSIRIYNTEDGQQLLDIPFSVERMSSSLLAWSHDGRHLFAASHGEAKCFDTAAGILLSKWSIHHKGSPTCIALARNQKFMVVSACNSLSFWDPATHKQIGPVVIHESPIWSFALSSNDDCVVTGEHNGKVILRNLHDILPVSYLTVNLPFMYISDAAFKLWTQGDWVRVEELLGEDIIYPSNPFHHARALALRALVRTRLKRCDIAIDDAKKSIEVQRSIIGYIAHAIAHVGNGEYESATRVFDLVFSEGIPSENRLLLLIKAIILFECGKHEDAVLRVDDLIDIVNDKSPYIAVRARMLLSLGGIAIRGGDNERAIELFRRAQEAIPFGQDPYLAVISLLFGWDFDRLAITIQLQLAKTMYAAGHSEVAESLSTIVETLGEGLLTDDVTTDWDPAMVISR
ncbi:WD40-repeat-containing domain protein [Boletus coccyginus]|nr:WD40-repeat-containing domain protein [Boletus coccyginus]